MGSYLHVDDPVGVGEGWRSDKSCCSVFHTSVKKTKGQIALALICLSLSLALSV